MEDNNKIEAHAFQYIFGYFDNQGLGDKIINDYYNYKQFCEQKGIEPVEFYRYVLDCTIIKYDSTFSE